jgi:hypothetical protein
LHLIAASSQPVVLLARPCCNCFLCPQALDAGEDGPLQQLELDLLIGCGSLQPSAVVASCLASAFIVWDGRLVVDSQFCSSDPAVMGAGPVAKFSRCVGVGIWLLSHLACCR